MPYFYILGDDWVVDLQSIVSITRGKKLIGPNGVNGTTYWICLSLKNKAQTSNEYSTKEKANHSMV